jgi:hypothetical protein
MNLLLLTIGGVVGIAIGSALIWAEHLRTMRRNARRHAAGLQMLIDHYWPKRD